MTGETEVLVVGAGEMGRAYVEVCLALDQSPLLVTRGKERARAVADTYPDIEVISGGVRPYLDEHQPPDDVILATPIETLAPLCHELIGSGVKRILAEKPLALATEEAAELAEAANESDTTVYVAFNRRHYTSVEMARERIAAAGGVSSFHFDFTEASFRIDPSDYAPSVMERWGVANSSHVIDMAFYLCGSPGQLDANHTGMAIDWHPAGSIFYGNGLTESGTSFTYHSNWGAPGRWNIEVNTTEEKLIFEPLERLKVQPAGQFEVFEVESDYSLDNKFKPGLYRQCERIFDGEEDYLLTLEGWTSELETIERIFGYKE